MVDKRNEQNDASTSTSLFEYLITNYRWFFVVFFLMPLSIVYEIYLLCRNTWTFMTYKSAPRKHQERVTAIQSQIKKWALDNKGVKMCTSRPGWQAMSLRAGKYKKTYENIHINLHDVLEVNTDNQTCRVEPMCTMGQITHALLPLGWTLPVVPELDDLTVGGLVSGVGIETSSHKYGLFQHICLSFEVVLPDSSVVHCSAQENVDLFYSVPWSHGTLGFVVSVVLRIIPSKKYVRLQYLPFKSKEEAVQLFAQESRSAQHDFIECLAYSPSQYVVMLGDLTDERCPGDVLNPIGLWYKEWFYEHVRKFLSSMSSGVELLPLRDYYHRHTKSLFWEVSDIIPFGNHVLFRWLFGWMMPPKPSLLKLTQTEALRKLYELHHVVQDMLVPMSSLSDCLSVFDREVGIYPLWLCPFTIRSNAQPASPHRGFVAPHTSSTGETEELFVDVGAYGNPTVKGYSARETHRRLEDFVRRVSGYQMMYADSYMTKEEFRSMFDHRLYDQLRESIPLCKQAFPEVYDKVSKAARI